MCGSSYNRKLERQEEKLKEEQKKKQAKEDAECLKVANQMKKKHSST